MAFAKQLYVWTGQKVEIRDKGVVKTGSIEKILVLEECLDVDVQLGCGTIVTVRLWDDPVVEDKIVTQEIVEEARFEETPMGLEVLPTHNGPFGKLAR